MSANEFVKKSLEEVSPEIYPENIDFSLLPKHAHDELIAAGLLSGLLCAPSQSSANREMGNI